MTDLSRDPPHKPLPRAPAAASATPATGSQERLESAVAPAPAPAPVVAPQTRTSVEEVKVAIGAELIVWKWADVLSARLSDRVLRKLGFESQLDEGRTIQQFVLVRRKRDAWGGERPGVVTRYVMERVEEFRRKAALVAEEIGNDVG